MKENKKDLVSQNLFEVWRNDTVLFCTRSDECIPERQQLKDMANYGYRFFLNGKPYKV
jgi:hypothetical protein